MPISSLKRSICFHIIATNTWPKINDITCNTDTTSIQNFMQCPRIRFRLKIPNPKRNHYDCCSSCTSYVWILDKGLNCPNDDQHFGTHIIVNHIFATTDHQGWISIIKLPIVLLFLLFGTILYLVDHSHGMFFRVTSTRRCVDCEYLDNDQHFHGTDCIHWSIHTNEVASSHLPGGPPLCLHLAPPSDFSRAIKI